LGELSQGKLEELEIVVPVRVHFRVELTDAQMADEVGALDQDGQAVALNVIQGNRRDEMERYTLVDGQSEILTVHDRTETVVLYKAGEEVERIPVRFQPGDVNRIER